MTPKLLRRKQKIEDLPILNDEYWQGWAKLELSSFPTVAIIENIPAKIYNSIDDLRFDELFNALMENCPLAHKIVPYVMIYLRTRKAKLTIKEFHSKYGLPKHMFLPKNALVAFKKELEKRPFLREELKAVYIGVKIYNANR